MYLSFMAYNAYASILDTRSGHSRLAGQTVAESAKAPVWAYNFLIQRPRLNSSPSRTDQSLRQMYPYLRLLHPTTLLPITSEETAAADGAAQVSHRPSGHDRYVVAWWLREPHGLALVRNTHRPIGKRPPNGLIRGHSLDHSFWFERIPGFCVKAVWPYSMMREFPDQFMGMDDPDNAITEPEPRPLRPWAGSEVHVSPRLPAEHSPRFGGRNLTETTGKVEDSIGLLFEDGKCSYSCALGSTSIVRLF
jgi:hypothetical protein